MLIGHSCSNYAAVAADTFSSELGILSKSKPRLLTSWTFREVPPGTNGGVTLAGTIAGFGGAAIIALATVLLIPFCALDQSLKGKVTGGNSKVGLEGGEAWGAAEKGLVFLAITVWGGLGSLLDSLLGGWLQESVVDSRTGKVVEGSGGRKVCLIFSRLLFLVSGLVVVVNEVANLEAGSRAGFGNASEQEER